MKNNIISLFLLLLSCPLWASQTYIVKDGETLSIRISAKELTRIGLKEGRISKIWGNGALEIKTDKNSGEIYIRPTSPEQGQVSFFIKDSFGSTYTLAANIENITSQTIFLDPFNKTDKGSSIKYTQTPIIKRIKSLVKNMASQKKAAGYHAENLNKKINFWKETTLHLKKIYSRTDLMGETYEIKNISSKKMILDEKEFTGFGTDIMAISLDKLALKTDESTFLYIVRRRAL